MKKKFKPLKRVVKAAERPIIDALERAHSLMARGRASEAFSLLTKLNQTHPQRQDVLRALIDTAYTVNDIGTFRYAAEKLYGLCPHDRNLPYMLASAYLQHQWPALALSTARRAVAQDPTNPNAGKFRELIAELEPVVEQEIVRLELEGPDGIECATMHDQIRAHLAQARFAKAREIAEQLVRRRPRFGPAYNNGADACWHDGCIVRAIDLTQRHLAFDSDNVYALSNLVHFLSAIGKIEEARRHAERLKSVVPLTRDHAIKRVEALAWLGDDSGVMAMLEPALRMTGGSGPDDDALLHHLAAVAAFRLGREDEARGHWQAALAAVPEFEFARANLNDLKRPARDRNAPWLFSINYFVPHKLVDELMAYLGASKGRKDSEAVKRTDLQRFIADHPILEGVVPMLLDRGDLDGREFALRFARIAQTPAMLQALCDFGAGQRGSDKFRLEADEITAAAGLIPIGPRRRWIDGAWRDISMMKIEIHTDVVKQVHAPGVFDLIRRAFDASRNGDFELAEQSLREALAIDPNDRTAMNNLALVCEQTGRQEEAISLSARLHEVHPDYLFGRTIMAGVAIDKGELDRAREMLKPLLSRQRLHISEFSAICSAQARLHAAAGDREQVKHWLGMWRQTAPDDPALYALEQRLRSMPNGNGIT